MRARAGGFALVSALFLLVILSLLGAYLVSIVAVQHATPALRINSSRAEYAARAGAAWGAQRAAESGACPPAAAPAQFTLANGGLGGFHVTVWCLATPHRFGADDAPTTRMYYVVTGRAEYGVFGTQDYVSRTIQAKVLGPAA